MKRVLLHILLFCSILANAQDPHYSQFFMAPQLLNPALAGTGNDARLSANFRQQWANAGTPFRTLSLSGDGKLINGLNGSFVGAGVTLMSDQSMNGAFKSNYAGAALNVHLPLAENHSVGLGFQASFGSRKIDYSELTFSEQFTSGGFDLSLPTGENALTSMKPFISLGTGFVYRYSYDYLNVEAGIAAYHLNKPQQTFVDDKLQNVPVRFAAFASGDYVLSDRLVINMNMCFQQQQAQNYFAIGGCTGLDISAGGTDKTLFTGIWYRSNDALYPYLGLLFDNVQLGISYDLTVSKQNTRNLPPQSIELSMIIRKSHKNEGVIPCPWK